MSNHTLKDGQTGGSTTQIEEGVEPSPEFYEFNRELQNAIEVVMAKPENQNTSIFGVIVTHDRQNSVGGAIRVVIGKMTVGDAQAVMSSFVGHAEDLLRETTSAILGAVPDSEECNCPRCKSEREAAPSTTH